MRNIKELKETKQKLLEMLKTDQFLRKTPGTSPTDIEKMDNRHVTSLKQLIKELNGWPTISKVGKKASTAAWLIAQHSKVLKFQKLCLRLMKKNVNDIDKANLAYITDIIGMNTGKGQVYGTSLETKRDENGKLVTTVPRLKYPKKVNKRRKELGLIPLEDYIKQSEDVFERFIENR